MRQRDMFSTKVLLQPEWYRK